MDVYRNFMKTFAVTWLVLLCIALSPNSAFAQDPNIGDFVYASPGEKAHGEPSYYGHAAIYVGRQYDANGKFFGDVVERVKEPGGGVRFTTLADLKARYRDGEGGKLKN